MIRLRELLYYFFVRLPLTLWGKFRGNLIRVHWGRSLHNFGDCLQPCILRHYGLTPVYATSQKNSDIILEGSIMQTIPADYKGIILGTGNCHETPLYHFPYARISGVRGALTMRNIAWDGNPEIILGDPGLLMPLVYPCKKAPQYDIGIIPHFVDKKRPEILSMVKNTPGKRLLIIDVLAHPKIVCRQMNLCKCIISSSLHGLILADAYDIPNVRFKINETQPEAWYDWKFDDYYSSFSMSGGHSVLNINMMQSLVNISQVCVSHYHSVAPLITALDAAMRKISRAISARRK